MNRIWIATFVSRLAAARDATTNSTLPTRPAPSQLARWVLCMTVAQLQMVGSAAAEEDDGPRGTRPYQADAVLSWRRHDEGGWSGRLVLAWVPYGDLVPSRRDRTAYLAFGLHVGGDRIEHQSRGPTSPVYAWNAGPVVRVGLAWGSRKDLKVHAYLSVAPLLTRVPDDTTVRDRAWHGGARVAMGISVPGTRRNIGERLDEHREGREEIMPTSSSADLAPFGDLLLVLGAVFMPDTLEFGYFRVGGVEYTTIGAGYSL